MLKVYSLFHLNTSFSSIERNKIPQLIKNCYWPLLNIVEKNNFKIAIECSGKTIEDIYHFDKTLVLKLKKLIKIKKCEFIGSGYNQIIGPITPPEITEKNLYFGNKIYKKFLGILPKYALINEQAFSKSLIKIYKKYYQAIIFDWSNAKKTTKKYFIPEPRLISDDYKNTIPVIWSNSIAFQKFQRFIYNEIDQNNYIKFLRINKKNKFICLYSNDAEIFNFRPKRFSSEAKKNINEWKKIEKIYNFLLKNNKKYKFCTFKEIIKFINHKKLILPSAEMPTVVKKQPKYNINRWALCGRDNLYTNTLCWRFYEALKKKKNKSEKYWLKLCDYWSSDLRTHTTKKKWNDFVSDINFNIKKLKVKNSFSKLNLNKFKKIRKLDKYIKCDNNYIIFFNKYFEIKFNLKKGLTLDSFVDRTVSNKSLFGTIYQGQLNELDSDYFSGHFDLISKNDLSKITDLSIINDKVDIYKNDKKKYMLHFKNKFKNGEILRKYIIIDLNKRELEIIYNFKKISPYILRLYNITLNPRAFNKRKLFLKTNNGGNQFEKFDITKDFNHGKIIQDVSRFTSSNNGLALTKGKLVIGDDKKGLNFETEKTISALIGMIHFRNFKRNFFLRSYFSAQESDDTISDFKKKDLFTNLKIKAYKN